MSLPGFIDVEGPKGRFCMVDSEWPGVVSQYMSDPEWRKERDTKSIFRVPFGRLGLPAIPRDTSHYNAAVDLMTLYVCAVALHPPRFVPGDLTDTICRYNMAQRFEHYVADLPKALMERLCFAYEAAAAAKAEESGCWYDFFKDWLEKQHTEACQHMHDSLFNTEENDVILLDGIYSPGAWRLDKYNVATCRWEDFLWFFAPPAPEMAERLWKKGGWFITTAMDHYYTSDMAGVFDAINTNPYKGETSGAIKARWTSDSDTVQLVHSGVIRHVRMSDMRRALGLPCGPYVNFTQQVVAESALSFVDSDPHL